MFNLNETKIKLQLKKRTILTMKWVIIYKYLIQNCIIFSDTTGICNATHYLPLNT